VHVEQASREVLHVYRELVPRRRRNLCVDVRVGKPPIDQRSHALLGGEGDELAPIRLSHPGHRRSFQRLRVSVQTGIQNLLHGDVP
jgi:hypothetical protein